MISGSGNGLTRLAVGVFVVSLLLGACGEPPVRDPAEGADVEPPAAPPPGQPERNGLRFDPATVRQGDSVGVLVVDTVDAQRTVVDSTYVGMARFRGRIQLSGRTIPHFDFDLRQESVCFEADVESAARLPRWLHDERRPWFCFDNPRDAANALGSASMDAAVTIIVDEFVIHRGFSDQVNSARFVERVGTDPSGR